MEAYLPLIKDALGMFLFLGVELSVLFILISAGVSLLQQYISDSKIQKLLGASKGRGYILAAGLGAITPFCTCSTIPMLRGLLRAKAGFGPTLTFLFASPLLNPIIIGLFVVTFGIKVTITYTIIALVVSIVAGIVLKHMGFESYVISELSSKPASCCETPAKNATIDIKPLQSNEITDSATTQQNTQATTSSCCDSKKPELTPFATNDSACCSPAATTEEKPAASACCATDSATTQPNAQAQSSSCCGSAPKPIGDTFSQKCKAALQDGYSQFKDVLPYLLLGISLGAIIYGFVPSDFIAKYASGDGIFAVPVAAVIGIPLYVRVEALIPLSEVLVGKGMGLGPVMALIIGGGGASLTEVILLKSIFKTPVIVAFLVVVLTMAIGAGYLFQFFF